MGEAKRRRRADPVWDESKVSRHPRGSGERGGRFRERATALEALAYSAGAALLVHEVNERAERGFSLLEYAHVTAEGMGVLHHLRTTTTDAARPDITPSNAWAERISGSAGSEVQRRIAEREAMDPQQRRAAEIRAFTAAASMPSEANLQPQPGVYGLSAESARPVAGGKLPARDPGKRFNQDVMNRIKMTVDQVDPAHQFYIGALIAKIHGGDIPLDWTLVSELRYLQARFGNNPRTAAALQRAAEDVALELSGQRHDFSELQPTDPTRLSGVGRFGPPTQHPGQMEHTGFGTRWS